MKPIEMLETAHKSVYFREMPISDLGVTSTFFRAYFNSQEAESEILDFSDVIWEKDIPAILQDCHRFDIAAFSISSSMSSIAETILEFQKHGCKLVGVAEVNGRFQDWKTGLRERKPAFMLEITPA